MFLIFLKNAQGVCGSTEVWGAMIFFHLAPPQGGKKGGGKGGKMGGRARNRSPFVRPCVEWSGCVTCVVNFCSQY